MQRQRMEMVLGIISAILLTGLGVALFVHANLGSRYGSLFLWMGCIRLYM